MANQHANALNAAVRDTTNLAYAFEDNTQRAVAGADQVLLSLRASYAREQSGFDLVEWVKRESAPDWLTAQIAIIGPNGMSVASTASKVSVNVADREHFIVQRDSDGDELFISRPVIGRSSGRWTVQLTRKIKLEDGRFGGIIVLSIDCYQLSAFYQSLNLQQGFIDLIGLDGIVRARGPVEANTIGHQMTGIPETVLAEKGGNLRIPDGHDQLTVAFRRLNNYPLVVLVGFNDKAILADFRHTRKVMTWSGVAATILLILVGSVWIRQRKRSMRSQRSLEVTLASMSQGLVMIDASGHVRVVNGRALDLLGLPQDMVAHMGEGRSKLHQDAERSLLEALSTIYDTRARAGDGMGVPVLERTISAIPTGGEVQTITDVTARHVADQRIRHMALHDHLTGLGNRILFSEEADHLLELAAAGGHRYAILCLDLNGFKKVNDTLGHEGGDDLLIKVAQRLTAATGPEDIVARVGGDEFAVLSRLGSHQAAQTGAAIAQQICAALETPFMIGTQQVKIGASIGVAEYPQDGLGRTDLLRNADLALYVAKADQQDSVRQFEPGMAEVARNKQRLEEELRAAIGTD
ncbi:MAG: diguanylate cyclase, partial [Alphaproteobacteria bacterium]